MRKIIEQPIWDEGIKPLSAPSLEQSINVDVAVVGAGLTGLLTAYALRQTGYAVVVLEKDQVGHGATGVTTAFLTQYIDTAAVDLIKMFGEAQARLILSSHGQAIGFIEEVVVREQIDCNFMRCSNYIYANADQDVSALQAEHKALATLQIKTELKSKATLPFIQSGSLELTQQAKFHPLQFLLTLAQRLQEQGVHIFQNSPVTDFVSGSPHELLAHGHKVRATFVVFATYEPWGKALYFKKAFYTSYVIGATISPSVLPEAIYEDTLLPYHYLRVERGSDNDQLLLGGADHRSDIPMSPEKNFAALEHYLDEHFVDIPYAITRRWKGPIIEPVDGLAYIGVGDIERMYHATGYSGNGMTYAAIAAQLISDLIAGRNNPWQQLYDPRRHLDLTALAYKGRDYSEELVGGAVKNSLKHRE